MGLDKDSRVGDTIEARWDGGASAPELDLNRVATPLGRRDSRRAMSSIFWNSVESLVIVKRRRVMLARFTGCGIACQRSLEVHMYQLARPRMSPHTI